MKRLKRKARLDRLEEARAIMPVVAAVRMNSLRHQSPQLSFTRSPAWRGTIKELSLDDDSKVAGKLPSPSVKPRSVDLKPTANDPLSLLNDEDDEEGGAFPANQEVVSQEKSDIAPTEGRVGALRPYKDLVLLRTGKPLYVPETQVSCK